MVIHKKNYEKFQNLLQGVVSEKVNQNEIKNKQISVW